MSPAEAPESPTANRTYPGAIEHLGLGPIALMRVVDCVKPERYDEQTEPGRFTLREAVAHLADFEVTILDRITLSQENPGGTVPDFNEDARAKEKDYASRDVHHELEVFQNRRRDTTSYLAGISPENMKRTFVHPVRGEMSVERFVSIVLGHDIYHIEHASQYLR